MAITLFGSASTPADNGTNTTNPTVVTAPGSMQAGDLCFIVACAANTSGDLAMSETGGQTWTALTQRNQTRNRARCFWAVYNGTWTANPSVTMAGTANNIVRMLVFRGDYGTANQWYVDVAEASATYAAPVSPYTVTVPNIVVTHAGTLGVITWTSRDDNTWGTLSGDWTALTPAQVRNTSGTYDQSVTNAYQVFPAAGNSLSISQNQATLGGDAGTYYSIVFAQGQVESAVGASAATADADATASATRAVAGASAATSAASATGYPLKFAVGAAAAVSAISGAANIPDRIYGFFNWLIGSPAVGGVAGPKLNRAVTLLELSSYVIGGTSADFNIEERSSPDTSGTDALAADQQADADGVSTATLANAAIDAGHWLHVDVSAVSGEVETLSITAKYTDRAESIVEAAGSSAASGGASGVISCLKTFAATVAGLAQSFARAVTSVAMSGAILATSAAAASTGGTVVAAGSSGSSSNATATLSCIDVGIGVYNWLVSSPATGGIAGPKMPVDGRVCGICSYVVGSGATVTFNVEERTSPDTSGTDLLSADSVADENGTTETSIANPAIDDGNWLHLDISATSGTPTLLSVTVSYKFALKTNAAGTSGATSSASARASCSWLAAGASTAASTAAATTYPVLYVSGSTGSSSSVSGSVFQTIGYPYGIYNWLVSSPAVGDIPGPKLPQGIQIREVSGYIIGGTAAAFNLQERTFVQTSSAFMLTSDLSVDADGNSTTTFTDDAAYAGRWLYLTIRSVDGSPTILSVTVEYTPQTRAQGVIAASSSATASATVTYTGNVVTAAGSTGSRFGTTGDFVRTRIVTASATAGGSASSDAIVTILVAAEGSSASTSTATATPTNYKLGVGAVASASTTTGAAFVTRAGVTLSSASTTTATASALVTRTITAASAATSTVTGFADYKDRAFGTIAATSSVTGSATTATEHPVAGTVASTSTASAAVEITKTVAGTVAATSSATAEAEDVFAAKIVTLYSTITASGTLTSTINGSITLYSTIHT